MHHTQESGSRSAPDSLESQEESLRESLVSWGFWLCLLAAVALYAAVALSPKFVRNARRNDEYTANQQKLLALNREVELWSRLVQDLESNDGSYRSLPSHRSSQDDVVAVDEAMRFRLNQAASASSRPSDTPSLLTWAAETIAGSLLVQIAGLVCSAGLLLFAFTMLTPPCAGNQAGP